MAPRGNQAAAALVVLGLLLSSRAGAQPADDTGNAAMTARASGYVDITAAGPTRLSGSVGGSIANNKVKGDALTGLSVAMGEVGPINRSPFVKVTIPVLIRSNTGYALAMSASPIANGPDELGLVDIGFGLGQLQRADPHVLPGSDSPAGAAVGDPTTAADANPATPRWDYARGKRLADYTTPAGIVSGPAILSPVPAGMASGLSLELYYCIKPQFFSSGAFSTTITLTVSSP